MRRTPSANWVARETAEELFVEAWLTALKTATRQKHLRCRHDLVLDLFTRKGEFWEHIRDLRARWQIEPTVAIPPPLVLDPIHYPSVWPDASSDNQRSAPSTPPTADECKARDQASREHWLLKVTEIATVDVQALCRGDSYSLAKDWAPFVAACALYDPPQDQLLEFAEASPVGLLLTLDQTDSEAQNEVAPGEGTSDLPLVRRQDARQVAGIVAGHYDRVFKALAESLRPHGVDLHAIRNDLETTDATLTHADLVKRIRAAPTAEFIQVRPETTKADVDAAYDQVRRSKPGPAKVKHLDSPLTHAQVAIWRQSISEEEVATRMRWNVHQDATLGARSSTVRNHASSGRKLLKERGYSI